jgi:hypothetical protein
MPKVLALHEMELQPGVEPEEYERFFCRRDRTDARAPGVEDPSSKG